MDGGLARRRADRISHIDFGYDGSPFADGDMVTFVTDMVADDASDEDKAAAKDAIAKIVAALADEADLPGSEADRRRTSKRRSTQACELMTGKLAEVVDGGMSCIDCHKFHDAGELGAAPISRATCRGSG